MLRATPFAWEDVALTELPVEAQAELDSRPAAASGSADEVRNALIAEEPRRVVHAVRAAIGTDPSPIVLAADPGVAGHFASAADLPGLLDDMVAANPFAFGDAELHRRALSVVQPLLDTEVNAVLDQVNARLGTAEPTVAIRLEEIIAAADEGRVDALIVASDEALWGRWEPGKLIAAHGHESPGDEDLTNVAAVLALRTGGRVFALPLEHLPRRSRAVATLRF